MLADKVSSSKNMKNSYKVLVGKSEEKKQIGGRSHTWHNITKTDVERIGSEDVDSIKLAQDKLEWQDPLNMVINFGVP